MTTDDVRSRAARLLIMSMPVVLRTVGRGMREAGGDISPQQMRVLGMIGACPRTLTEIAGIHGVTPATATTLVTTLESHGWLVRERDADDRRRVVVTLTEAGKVTLERSQELAMRAVCNLLEPLTDEQLHELIRGMEVLRTAEVAAGHADSHDHVGLHPLR
jgi:DNA-binding MarR family transcriptional regulator